MKGRKILEINPEHELIKQLDAAFLADKESPAAVQVARVLYDTALLESGYALGDAKSFSQRVAALALASLPQLAYPEDSEPDPEPRKAWVRPDAPPPASDEEAAEQAREVAATLRDMEAAKEGGEGGEEEKAAPAAEVGARDEL